MSDFVGKTISLISKKNLRYVGILESINADDATIALRSVRMFGTEGRLGQPHLEVPPGNDIYDYVVFRGNDVEDLSVLDVPIEQVRPIYPPQPVGTSGFYPPGPTPTSQQQQPPQPPQTFQQKPSATTANVKPGPSPAQAATGPTETAAAESVASPSGPQQPTKTSTEKPPTKTADVAESQPGTVPEPNRSEKENVENDKEVAQSQPESRPSKNSRASRESQTKDLDFKEDFDFEQSNAKFHREAQEEGEAPKYNKQSSFFDSISSSTEERGNNRNRWAEERSLNFDTFGESGARGGRGRGRGRGRGNYRGRGRGNYRGNWRGRSEPKPEWA
ncbi:hypothetical protein CANMA_003803 [Candida margitis]|uniref:uncharacterized protein n=1 Tax=Candida margitis TaxID=1775924 RepID=UPI00222783A9|nr:uncharacterized protein CANMA_003803 [Candida margitis]KAI5961521.1 hypothetical protein CANMA_003803 [Candida margitis]